MIDIEGLKQYAYDIIGAIHEVVVELKSVESLTSEHKAQLFNYMRLLKVSVGILVNFYPRFAEIERYFYNPDDNELYGSDGFPIRKYV